jgi:hypothetical protein
MKCTQSAIGLARLREEQKKGTDGKSLDARSVPALLQPPDFRFFVQDQSG